MSFAHISATSSRSGAGPKPRGAIAEWTISLLLVLFSSSTLVQAYVIPTGSMEGNLLIGDQPAGRPHGPTVIPAARESSAAVPRDSARRHHRFPYPLDPRQTYVKRVIGLPGDRISPGKRAGNTQRAAAGGGHTRSTSAAWPDAFATNFPQSPPASCGAPRSRCWAAMCRMARIVVPRAMPVRDGRQSARTSIDSRYWAFVPAAETVLGRPLLGLLVLRCPDEDLRWSGDQPSPRRRMHFFDQDSMEPHIPDSRGRNESFWSISPDAGVGVFSAGLAVVDRKTLR